MASLVGAIGSLISAITVLFLAVSARLAKRKADRDAIKAELDRYRIEAAVAATGRTAALTAATVGTVAGKLDTNTKLTEAIHDEVHSANGITGTELLERQEGRRIEEISKADRTPNEQGYVDRLEAGGRNK